MQNAPSIAPLTKVSVKLKANPSIASEVRLPASEIHFSFIYGIGTEGITAFEKTLHGMAPGDQLTISVPSMQRQNYFEHLLNPLMEAIPIDPPFDLEIGVQSVTPVSDRELVHALARKSEGSGCGCDCECGCG
jgi:hypothetical protein